eukprot:g34805.t1
MISKFADDTKIGGVVDSEEGYLTVQQDLDEMGWEVADEFNLDTYEVLHFGQANQSSTYTLNGKVLRSVAEQRDLGEQVHISLKAESQVDSSVFSPGNPFGQSQLSRSHYHPSSPQRIPQQPGKKVVKPGQCQLPRASLTSEPPLASQDAPRQTDQPAGQGEGTDAGIASPLVESWPSTESSSLLMPEGEPGSEAR